MSGFNGGKELARSLGMVGNGTNGEIKNHMLGLNGASESARVVSSGDTFVRT